MKYFLHIFIYIFIFVGCTTKDNQNRIYDNKASFSSSKIDKQRLSKKDNQNTKTKQEIQKKIKNEQIAIVYPSSTIGKYAREAINSINSYLLFKGDPFSIVTIDMVTHNDKNLNKSFEKIKNDNVTKVILMLTASQLKGLSDIDGIENVNLYLPLVNVYEIEDKSILESLKVTFGAISYKEQFKRLLEHAGNLPLAELYDNSLIGNTLHNYIKSNKLAYKRKIDDNNGRYKNFLKNNSRIRNSAVILNTPIVKSSILLSAITAQEVNPAKILSTQLNYTPLLFSLTQKNDRKNLIVANSIGNIPVELDEFNQLLGNNILYSWVNYSCLVGVEYLMSNNIDYFSDLELKQKQVVYPVKLYEVGENSFKLIK